jgi:hypothetical protein
VLFDCKTLNNLFATITVSIPSKLVPDMVMVSPALAGFGVILRIFGRIVNCALVDEEPKLVYTLINPDNSFAGTDIVITESPTFDVTETLLELNNTESAGNNLFPLNVTGVPIFPFVGEKE